MTPERFSTLVEAYGGDPARWPAAERASARDYLARTPAARAEIEAALRLDALLDRLAVPASQPDVAALVAVATRARQEPPQAPAQRAAQVVALASRRAPIGPARRPIMAWVRAGALAAAGIAGFIVGVNVPATTADTTNASVLEAYDEAQAQVEDASW